MRSSTLVLCSLVCLSLLLCLISTASADSASTREKLGKYNARVGSKFLQEKAKEDGVTSLESGVLYKILTSGKGKKSPGPTDKVKVHYAGTLINGKEFDSSYSRGSPAEFGVNGVIKGWTEILQLMKEGDIWEVYIPSDKAYGTSGSGAKIGPNSTLVFKVELIQILGGGGGGPAAGGKRPPPPQRKPPTPKKQEEKEL